MTCALPIHYLCAFCAFCALSVATVFGFGEERQALNREASINPWGIEGDEAMDALVDALCADPGELPGSQPNPRGAGHVWGPDYTRRFLKSTNLKLVIRSHQVPVDQNLERCQQYFCCGFAILPYYLRAKS